MTTTEATGCTVLHVDMDAFYACVAIRDRPELQGLPVVAGGGDRGVVLSASYAARRFGIHSAMSMTRARRLCPQVVVVHPDYDELSTVSVGRHGDVPQRDPDRGGAVDGRGVPRHHAGRCSGSRPPSPSGSTCGPGSPTSSGSPARWGSPPPPSSPSWPPGGPSPTGWSSYLPTEVTAFLHPLPVDELWGVGEKTAEQLRRLGLRTVGDLAHTPVATLQRAVGPLLGARLHALAWGEADRPVTARRGPDEPDHSIGSDETFGRDTDDHAVVARELLRLTRKVAGRMRTAGVAGRTVVLKVQVRRLHHDHPLAHAARGHQPDAGDLRHRARAVRRARPAAGPASPGGGPGPGARGRGDRDPAADAGRARVRLGGRRAGGRPGDVSLRAPGCASGDASRRQAPVTSLRGRTRTRRRRP